MSLNLITAENLRDPLAGILNTIVEGHIAHRLVDDFLIVTPDDLSASDLESALLNDPRLGGVLTGASVLSLPAWISSVVRELEPKTLAAPEWALEALFCSLASKSAAAKAWGERVSILSLFQLISAFREEMKSLESLKAFVSELDPTLAIDCHRLAADYAAQIEALPSGKDFAWRAARVLKGVEKNEIESLKRIKTLYWLGFPQATPLLKNLTERIQSFFPQIEQMLHIQMPKGMDPQDWAASRFEEKSGLHHFASPSGQEPETVFKEFPGPFDEAGFVLTQIFKLCAQGKDPETLALFLPPDPFWESYFATELNKLGLNLFERHKRPLASFPEIAETLSLRTEEALQKIEGLLPTLRLQWPRAAAEDLSQAASISLKIRGLQQWGEVLHQVLFYRTEIPDLQDFLPPLSRIARTTYLEERRSEGKGVALRSHRKPGLKSFSHAFLWGLSERSLPLSPERFFGRALPDSNRDLDGERARFQHLLGSSSLKRSLSYSIHTPKTEEVSPSPFLFEFGFQKPEKSSHPPLFSSRHLRKDFRERRERELLRERDLSYRYPHGGWIQDEEVLRALQARLKDHLFSPGQLQTFSECPFKFYAGVLLGLKPSEEKELEGSAAERGSWVHRFLEFFFSQNRAEIIEAGRDPKVKEKILNRVEPALEELSLEFLKDKPWIHETLSRDYRDRAAAMTRRLLENTWESLSHSERPFLPTYFEKTFGKGESPPLSFESPKGLTLRIGGRIDRIDVTEDGREFLIFDYKTGETGDLSRRIRELKSLQFPLYIAAAERLLEGAKGSGALVLGLKEMKGAEGMLKKAESKRLRFKGRSALYEEEAWRDYWPQLEGRLFQLLERILSGDFRTTPDPCNAYCEFGTICRYHEREKINR